MGFARSSGAGFAHNGLFYVVGGSEFGAPVNIVEAYDPGSDTWSIRPNLPTAR